MKKTILRVVVLTTLVTAVACKKQINSSNSTRESNEVTSTDLLPGTNERLPDKDDLSVVVKQLNSWNTASDVFINYTNLVKKGFDTESKYWAVDFNGDKVADIIERRINGTLHFYRGYVNAPNNGVPDQIGESTQGLEYKLSNSIQIGSGFNFVRYFFADFNGDFKCDIIGQNPDGKMWRYYSNGSSLTSGAMQVRLGQAPQWSLTSKFVAADKNGDNTYELIEFSNNSGFNYQQSWTKGGGNTWRSYGFAELNGSEFDANDEFIPLNIDQDSDVDFFIRKPNGDLFYSKCSGLSISYSNPVQCGNGWDGFTEIYGKYHWSCVTSNASLTGRQPNGDLYLYKWNMQSNSFSPGVVVGTGWNFTHLLTANFFPDQSQRDDYVGINPDGKMHAYTTLVQVN